MSYGSYTATQLSTAKLEISLLLKPSASGSPQIKRPLEEFNEDPSSEPLGVPLIGRTDSTPQLESRRISESSNTSIATTPTLVTAATSRQPSLTAATTPELRNTHMELSPRPVLPPLRHSPPALHQSPFFQHQSHSPQPQQPPPPPPPPAHYLTPHYQGSYSTPSSYPSAKRQRTSSPPNAITQPAKKQSKWTPDEDAVIIELRGSGMKWEDISKKLPGRSAISCRLHYQNYLERRSEWDEEKKNRLARLYERLKPEMWSGLAAELGIPWRAAEAMHWQLGEAGMAGRAGVTPFSLNASQSQSRQNSNSHSQPTIHQRGHSDPPMEQQIHHPQYPHPPPPQQQQYHHHQQPPPPQPHQPAQQQFSPPPPPLHHHQYLQHQQPQRYTQPPPEPRYYQQPPPPPSQHSNTENPEVVRLTRPPSPVLNLSPGEQSRRLLPSMAELDQGLTAAAMVDAQRRG